METKLDLKATIDSLEYGEHENLPATEFTASAVRKAVQRLKESGSEKDFRVSETAYPFGTRITRIK